MRNCKQVDPTYTAVVTPRNADPADEGLTMEIRFAASNQAQAKRRIARYMAVHLVSGPSKVKLPKGFLTVDQVCAAADMVALVYATDELLPEIEEL
jgi:hypothetical protein